MNLPPWLQELKDAEAKATPGPWFHEDGALCQDWRGFTNYLAQHESASMERDTVLLIALARNELPRLIRIAELAQIAYDQSHEGSKYLLRDLAAALRGEGGG